ncbi:MAG: LysR family transcriptional regulator [Candidatus Aminicenantes bacterium]|nr:LysR family transcriptional regulator [Candidatus Aminicenantes bacterium]MDH5743947.1 LysR family transcriptional regulator [Candidatus Aminicenantes bacterium]
MRLDTRYIDTFLAVLETGGITRAAEQLCLTQPAVSHRIRMFERGLNIRLFKHQGRKIVPTDAARRLEKICRRYLNDLSSFHSELFQSEGKIRETICIGSVSGFGRFFLFPLLCTPEFSHFRLHLSYPLARDIFRDIEEGNYQLGFVYHKKLSHQLTFQTVYKEELVLIGSPQRHFEVADVGDVNSYQNIPFITYDESDYVFGKWFESNFGTQPRTIPSYHHFEELEEVITMVVRGDGLSIVPDYTVSKELTNHEIEIIRPKKTICYNQVYAVTPTNMTISKSVIDLIEQIKSLGSVKFFV